MTTRYDLLDQYIDARNAGSGADFDVSDDPELSRLFDTVDRLDGGEPIEWPDGDFPSRMAGNLSNELSPFPRVYPSRTEADDTDDVTELHGGGVAGPLQEEGRGPWYWVRQLGGMAAAALVVVLFAGGLALIFESWDDGVQPGGAMVEPGDLPGTIAYVEYDSQRQEQTISRIDADGTDQSTLARRPSLSAEWPGIAWSPDGRWIAYLESEEPDPDAQSAVARVSVDGEETQQITDSRIPGAVTSLDISLKWSPDGESLILAYPNADGDRFRLGTIYLTTGEIQEFPQEGSVKANYFHPQWAPNGRRVVFTRTVPDENTRGIYTMMYDDTEPQPIIEDDRLSLHPSWSRDGESIAYIGESDNPMQGNVHVIDIASGQAANISNHQREDALPKWSSRNHIAFLSTNADRERDLFLVSPDGSDLQNLTENYDWQVFHHDWSDDGRYLSFTSSNEDQTEWRLNVYDVETNEFYTVLESENPLHHAMWQPTQEEPPIDEESPATPEFELSEEERERERAIAQAMLEEAENNTPALEVNGETITAGRFGLSLAAVESNLAFMQGSERADSIDDPEALAFFEEQRMLIEETGVENVALGSLLAEVVTIQWGLENGQGVSQEEIDATIEQQRNNIGDRAATYTEVIGEDRYWNEVYPQVLERTMTRQKVRQAVVEDAFGEDRGPQVDQESAIFNEFQTELLNDADIEILDHEAVHNADLDTAIEYITEAYPALQEEYASTETGQGGEHDLLLPDDAALPDGESAVAAAREYAVEEGTELGEIRQARMMNPRDVEEEQPGSMTPEMLENNTPIWRVEFATENGSSVFWLNAVDGTSIARMESATASASAEAAPSQPSLRTEEMVEARVQMLFHEHNAPDAEILSIEAMTVRQMNEETGSIPGPDQPVADEESRVWRVETTGDFRPGPVSSPEGVDPLSSEDSVTVLWFHAETGEMLTYNVQER